MLNDNFNPRSRVGSDFSPRSLYAYSRISIHAPAWGATILGQQNDKDRIISIHAPAWGATNSFFIVLPPYRYFNPRSRVGSDWCRYKTYPAPIQFQSTLPRGERPQDPIPQWLRPYFNPRSRVGSDFEHGYFRFSTNISIHAPAWGATTILMGLSAFSNVFQSTLPRGERP